MINLGYLIKYFRIPIYYYIIALLIFVSVLLIAKRFAWVKRIIIGLLISYAFLVLTVTVFSRSPSDKAELALEPFRFFKMYRVDEFIHFEIQANILLFIPIGFLLASSFTESKWLPVVLGLSFSVAVEIFQFITHTGVCETDDVISNLIGTIIGWLLFWMIKYIWIILTSIVKRIICRRIKHD